MSADSDQRSGRPSTSRNADVIDKVRTLIMEDRHLTIPEIADEQLLRLEVAQDMLECTNRDPEFLKTVITGDETWVYGYDPETKGFLAKNGILQVRQAPYSPDMTPCVFWLFSRMKTPPEGSRFDSREGIIQNATAQLHTILKQAFQNCFQRWKDRWAKYVESQGAYFEGD
ncbi:uncharacterized protein LOC110837702 [Zootermopsis nevadensis]|uniref:uncharacterized protein LOC110837702 n=1 Tax=Zootermopsis nevadensis TaxID=136037 RepID=UPI000B8E84E8|nr:uncharacterized protein LOC110837702 [Zootermopsis nevadensis]